MGGTALGEQLSRLSRKRYFEVATALTTKLSPFFDIVEIPACLDTKESFGDVDLIVSGPRKPLDAVKHLGSKMSDRNGHIVSFEFEGHQIDLISAERSKLDLARFYYSYGDLGMIVGMMCRVFGLKFGFKGLSLMHDFRRIKLSDDLTDILDFLGFNKEEHDNRFKRENDVFRFITTSRYFRPGLFARSVDIIHDPSSTKAIYNCDTKNRLLTRDMFRRFVEHCSTLDGKERLSSDIIKQDALAYFNKQHELDALIIEESRRAIVKQKFNGKIVNEITGLSGAELGRFMSSFKQSCSMETMLNSEPSSLTERITAFYNEYDQLQSVPK